MSNKEFYYARLTELVCQLYNGDSEENWAEGYVEVFYRPKGVPGTLSECEHASVSLDQMTGGRPQRDIEHDETIELRINEHSRLIIESSGATFVVSIPEELRKKANQYRCPVCAVAGPFMITVERQLRMDPDGGELSLKKVDQGWLDSSDNEVKCEDCGFIGHKAAFAVSGWDPYPPPQVRGRDDGQDDFC